MHNLETIESVIKDVFEPENKPTYVDTPEKSCSYSTSITVNCHNNVVSAEKLKNVQKETMNLLKNYLSKTYGPMGSYTAIISGTGKDTIKADYSKDGLKVLKNIIFDSPIELSIQSELREICQYVEGKVGDGTTSAVILSALIYNELLKIMEEHNIPPRKIVKEFKSIVDICKKLIENCKKDITVDDIYNISFVSTNGNEYIANIIRNIYNDYGFDVNIDVSISNDTDTKIKEYDGLIINEGYSDPAYINNNISGTAEIHDALVYAFQDPIDTPEMLSYFEKIIYDNIFVPINNGEAENVVPTVIIAPMISRDGSGILTRLVNLLYEYDKASASNQKPPILILTNIQGTTDEGIALDIERLCDCKMIKKYINSEVQKKDQELGIAPTLETVHEFAGKCELVSADHAKTKFINPVGITTNPEIYSSLVNFLESEIKNCKNNNEDGLTIGRLEKRLKCLKANIVELFVGGISVSDRDSLRDLVEDAVKNCASAAEYGVGRAANFEGLHAIYYMLSNSNSNSNSNIVEQKIIKGIFKAYYEAAKILYSTVLVKDEVDDAIKLSLANDCPFDVMELFESTSNISDIKPGNNILCSIRTDIEILDAISKIITMMVTSNQCLVQTTTLNKY